MAWVEREYLVCDDCMIAHANGDFSGMSEARAGRVKAGMDRTGHLHVGDLEAEFSWTPCGGCGSGGGPRHKAVRLTREGY